MNIGFFFVTGAGVDKSTKDNSIGFSSSATACDENNPPETAIK